MRAHYFLFTSRIRSELGVLKMTNSQTTETLKNFYELLKKNIGRTIKKI